MWIILGIATVLRLILLNQSLWLDESIEALALMGKQGPLLQYALGDYQPPLYHFIGYVTTHLFGYSEIALRLPSLLAGIATVYFVMKIGEFVKNKQVGYIAGLLAATNPLLIYYAQEGRTYAMTTFFVTASFYYFLRLLKDKSRNNYVLYTLCTICFLWTSYLSWFVFLVQVGYALYRKRRDIFSLQMLSGATLIAWLPSFISSLGIGQATRALSPDWGRVVGGLTWKSFPLTWVKFVIGRISFTNKWLYAVIVGMVALGHATVLKRVSLKKNGLFLLWIGVPVILGILIATILPIYQYFRVLFVLPAYLILLALGLSQSSRQYLTHVLIALQVLFLGIFWFSPQYQREDWRSLARDLQNDPGSTIAMPSRAQDAPLIYYGVTRNIIEPMHEQVSGEKIYYIRYVEDLFDTGKLGQANLQRAGYTITGQKVYAGIQVDIYENRN